MLRIDKIMRDKGITTQELSEKMKVTPQYVSEVVNGRKNITIASLNKFAEALDVPIAALMYGYKEQRTMSNSKFICPHCGNIIKVSK